MVRGTLEASLNAILDAEAEEMCSRNRQVHGKSAEESPRANESDGAFADGNSALTLVAAKPRHVFHTTWGTRKYMNKTLLKEMDQEAICSVA